jgi:hypothetical protein
VTTATRVTRGTKDPRVSDILTPEVICLQLLVWLYQHGWCVGQDLGFRQVCSLC